MGLHIRKTAIKGCFELIPEIHDDKRGRFVKTFEKKKFSENGLTADFAEEFYTFSNKRVLRGLHFQAPPMDYKKLVYCVYGSVIDAVVDLRRGSPTYGKYEIFDLDPHKANMVYLDSGLAHGFYVKSDGAILMYKVTCYHSPDHDKGVAWNSVGIPWPDKEPIISERDKSFPAFSEFVSPFRYE